MNKLRNLCILNLPNPPKQILDRDYAGGFGVSRNAPRKQYPATLNCFIPFSAGVAEKKAWNHSVIDAQALWLSEKEILDRIAQIKPDIILSMLSLPSLTHDLQILDTIKRFFPNILVVACGTVCNVTPTEILSNHKVDLLFQGSFPYTSNSAHLLEMFSQEKIQKILEGSLKDNLSLSNRLLVENYEDIDNYSPVYSNLQLGKYAKFTDLEGRETPFIPIIGSIGCPHTCYYCPYPVGFGHNVIFRQPKNVVNEIEQLHNLGINGFLFRTQSFTQRKTWASQICYEILDRKLRIQWVCEARANEATEELLDLMKKAGCSRIHYGVETGDPKLIQTEKPGVSIDTVQRTFKLTKEAKIWSHAHLIVGLPGETWNTIKKTSKLISNIKPDSIGLNFATPYPGTNLFRIAQEKGLILTLDFNKYSADNVVMRSDELEATELYQARFKIAFDFFKSQLSSIFNPPITIDSGRKLIKYHLPNIIDEEIKQFHVSGKILLN